MNRAFFMKSMNDGRLLLLACAAGLFTIGWIRVLIVASMEAGRFQKIVRNLPDIVKRLSPVPIEDLVNYPGLIGFTFEEPIVYLLLTVWCVSRGSDIVSGEISRGTMEVILSQPISRLRYLLIHHLVSLIGLAILAAAVLGGTHVGIETATVEVSSRPTWHVPIFGFNVPLANSNGEPTVVPMTDFVATKMYIASTLNFFCLGVFLTGLSAALSSFDRFRWRTIGLVVGIYVVETVIELTGMAVQSCWWMLNFTFFAVYEPVSFATEYAKNPETAWKFFADESLGYLPDFGPLGCDFALLAMGTSAAGIGAIVFIKRDLPAPL